MGNFLSGILNTDAKPNVNDYSRFDGFTKQQVVDYIKQLKPGALEVGDDFADKLKDVDLVCLTLLAMNIEFYDKASKLVGKHTHEKTLKETMTRQRFIAPKFGLDKLTTDSSRTPLNLSQYEEPNLGSKVIPSTLMNSSKITITEYNDSFRTPTDKKDLFGISKKILSNIPNFHKQRLINIYNKLLNGDLSAQRISLGRASYMYKESKKGPTDDMSSFRQIVTIPNSLNHYHRILALRLNEFLTKNNYMNTTIQKGSVSGIKYGILEQIFKIKQIIKDANEHKKECSIMFMDISNAFGNISLERLFGIMRKYHIHEQFIEYVKNFYDGFEYYVQTKEWTTNLKKWEGGLIQGCPLSPTLFVLAIDYVLTYLDAKYKETHGYSLNNENKIMFLAFVDDICIVCNNNQALNDMFQRVKLLLNSIGLSVNVEKCAYMTINPSDETKVVSNVPVVKSYKYLGEYISSDGSANESYTKFIAMLGNKLVSLDRKKVENDIKIKFFSKCMLPWIQRKLMVMYDISIDEKKKIVSTIKKYLLKWGNEEEIHIFTFIADILLASDDSVINKIDVTDEFDNDLKDELELVNSSFAGTSINITYDHVNKEPQVENVDDKKIEEVATTKEEVDVTDSPIENIDNSEYIDQQVDQQVDQQISDSINIPTEQLSEVAIVNDMELVTPVIG